MADNLVHLHPQRSIRPGQSRYDSINARAIAKYLKRVEPEVSAPKEAILALLGRKSIRNRLEKTDINAVVISAADFAEQCNGAKEAKLLSLGAEVAVAGLGPVQLESIPYWFNTLAKGKSEAEARAFLVEVLVRILGDAENWIVMRELVRVQKIHGIWQIAYYKPSNRMQASAASP
jgi:hypothetical protein